MRGISGGAGAVCQVDNDSGGGGWRKEKTAEGAAVFEGVNLGRWVAQVSASMASAVVTRSRDSQPVGDAGGCVLASDRPSALVPAEDAQPRLRGSARPQVVGTLAERRRLSHARGHDRRPGRRPINGREPQLIRLALPDRPGGLALVASRLAAHGVDILRVEVVEGGEDTVVDDLLVAGGDLVAALAALAADVEILGLREHAELPDPGLAMADALAA